MNIGQKSIVLDLEIIEILILKVLYSQKITVICDLWWNHPNGHQLWLKRCLIAAKTKSLIVSVICLALKECKQR